MANQPQFVPAVLHPCPLPRARKVAAFEALPQKTGLVIHLGVWAFLKRSDSLPRRSPKERKFRLGHVFALPNQGSLKHGRLPRRWPGLRKICPESDIRVRATESGETPDRYRTAQFGIEPQRRKITQPPLARAAANGIEPEPGKSAPRCAKMLPYIS
jgi:hypothetical protein